MDPDWVDVFPIQNGDIPASYVSLPKGNHEPPFFSKYPEIIRNYQEILINQENHPERKIHREYPAVWTSGVSSMGTYIKQLGAWTNYASRFRVTKTCRNKHHKNLRVGTPWMPTPPRNKAHRFPWKQQFKSFDIFEASIFQGAGCTTVFWNWNCPTMDWHQ